MVHRQVDGVLGVHLVQAMAVVRDCALVNLVQVGGARSSHDRQRRRLLDDGGFVVVPKGKRRHGLGNQVRRVHHGREEGLAVRGADGQGRCRIRPRGREEIGAGKVGRGWRRRRSREGVLSRVHAKGDLCVDPQVRAEIRRLLRNGSINVGVLLRGRDVVGLLDVERRHGRLEHGKVNRARH